eukprot:TRINITY_DN36742_c0_g1_i1.p2 TRINITY_DN36742_c0_g1~~TRINITY_DN36742_c0_g1_i1.p2  ORF type:complete len:239 (+),score=83.38 TRINITY_DN36742_c0_g1_i1:85-717(+)
MLPAGVQLVLGSSSKWRRQVLEQHFGAGIVALQVAPDIDEKAVRDPDPGQCALKVARAKAAAVMPKVAAQFSGSGVVICSDQVVVHCGAMREKPESAAQNKEFLRSYRPDAPAETLTAVVATALPGGRRAEGLHVARVHWRPIDEAVIDKIVANGQSLTCAGGLWVEDPDLQPFVERIEGGIDSVQGMPLGMLADLVRQVTAPQAPAAAD